MEFVETTGITTTYAQPEGRSVTRPLRSEELQDASDRLHQLRRNVLGSGAPRDTSGLQEGELYGAITWIELKARSTGLLKSLEGNLKRIFSQMQLNRGEILYYKATDRAMRALVRSGELGQNVYREIKLEALGRSDLDGDRGSISESSGSKRVRLEPARERIESNKPLSESEHSELRRREAEISRARWRESRHTIGAAPGKATANTPKGAPPPGWPDGYLWKPVSDSDGGLVVLLSEKQEEILSVRLLSPDGEGLLATGRYSGIGNGRRLHFRFEEPGSSLPDGVRLAIQHANGETATFEIAKPAARIG